MLPITFLIAIIFATCKPHRTVASRSSNKPLQATETFTGTICASCEEVETCGTNTTVIESATVTVDGEETEVTIDSDGNFDLSLEPGEHTIEVTINCPYANGTESSETATSSQTVTINNDSTPKAAATFILQCSSLCSVTVPVVVQVCSGCNETLGCDPDNGTALVEGRMMALVPVNGSSEAQTATIDSEGNGTFDAVTPGDYYVHVYDEPYGNSTIEVAGQITVEEPASEEAAEETQYFGPLVIENATLCYDPTYITGRVCADCEAEPPAEGETANGSVSSGCTSPLANATVRLTVVDEEGNEVTVEGETDEEGYYELEPANVTGNYTLEVIAPECSGDEETVFAEVSGEINATSAEPVVEVNVSGFCSMYCTANVTGRIYAADNETANYTDGITNPLSGITVELVEGPPDAAGEVVATAVTNSTGQYEFLFVPFGTYTLTAREVPTAGGPSGEGCELGYDDISIQVDVEENVTYNTTIVRVQECNNGTLCGQILMASSYCTTNTSSTPDGDGENNNTSNSTFPWMLITIPATNCSCSAYANITPPIYPIRPVVPPGTFPPPPPPPPPPPSTPITDIERLWRAFLLGTNYPMNGIPPPPPPPPFYSPDNTTQSSTTTTAPSSSSSSLPLSNQRIQPSNLLRCPSGCGCSCNRPSCPPCPPIPPLPPYPYPPPPLPPFPSPNCTCTVNGSFQGCFEVISPLYTAVARLYRLGQTQNSEAESDETGTNTTQLFQFVGETEVYPNGTFCFVGLPEGEEYYLEITVSENDTLDLTRSNISEALGAITSTVVTQEGTVPPTQQIISFGPINISGSPETVVEPFTAVFTNNNSASNSVVTLTNATFIPSNTSSSSNSSSSPPSSAGNSSIPAIPILPASPQIRHLDPFGQTYIYPLYAPSQTTSSPSPSSSSVQIVTPSAKQPVKKPKSKVLRERSATPSSSSSTITVIRPQQKTQAPISKKQTSAGKSKSSSSSTISVNRPATSSSSSTSNKNKSSQQKRSVTTHKKTVSTKQSTTSSATVTRRG